MTGFIRGYLSWGRYLALIPWLGVGPALAADFRISSFAPGGLLCWTNAFPTGVCTIESADSPLGPWTPRLNSFTISSGGQSAFPVASHNQFYRLLAVDISAGNPNGFTNLAHAYGLLHTIAGNGSGSLDNVNYWQSSFEGGLAVNAALSRPHIAFGDGVGNVFIVDKNSHSVLKVTPDGRIHTVAGTHTAGDGPDTPTPGTNVALNSPNGLWLGGDGTLFVLDTGNGKVRCLDTNGSLTTLFTDAKGISGGRGLWVKDDRTVAYFDDGSNVKSWTPAAGFKNINKNGFNDVANFVLAAAGNLIVTDRGANQVYLLATSGANAGTTTPLFGNGTINPVVDGTPALSNGLYGVRGVWPVPTGGYLLATQEGCQILYVDPTGILHIFVNGAEGDHAGDGQWFYGGFDISEPRCVTLDSRGNILLVENDAGYVRQVDFLRLSP